MISKRGLALVALIMFPVGALAALLQVGDDPPTELYVRTTPPGATVYLDGEQLGTTPQVFEVTPGKHELVAVHKGSKSITQVIDVPANEIKRVILPLQAGTTGATAEQNAAVEEEKWQQRLETLLARRGTSVNYEDISVTHMLESLARSASSVEGAEVKIVIDRQSLADAGISLPTLHKAIKLKLKNTTMGTVLDRALNPRGLSYEIKGGKIVIRALKPDAIPAAPTGRLDLRVAVTRNSDPDTTRVDREIDKYVEDLKANGPEAGRLHGDHFAWFPCSGEPGSQLITAEYKGETFALLANTPAHTMLSGSEPAWCVTSVSVDLDPQGHPTISMDLDEAGGRRFGELTGTHLKQPLAILVDDQVISAPTVMTKITKRLQITGRFTPEEAQRLAQAIKKGMARPKPDVDTPNVGEAVLPLGHDVTKNEYRWPIAAHPQSRLATGFVSFDEKDGRIAIREHVGGGASKLPLDEPIELVLRTPVKDGLLSLEMTEQWKAKAKTVTGSTVCPEGSVLRARDPMPVTEPTTEYQVFWRGDFVKQGRVVKSVAYVVRLSPLTEDYDGLDKEEIPKVIAAIREAEGSNQSAVDEERAERILRGYAEAVVSELAGKLPEGDWSDKSKVVAEVGSELAGRHIRPHVDLLAAHLLGRLPKAEPVDLSEWEEIPLKAKTVKLKDLAAAPDMLMWNPVALAGQLRQIVMMRELGAEAIGKRNILQSLALPTMVLSDSSVDKPVIATPMGSELFIVRLERRDDGFYACRDLQWLRRKPTSSKSQQIGTVVFADPSPFQKMMGAYSDAVWSNLLPKLDTLDADQILQEAQRLAEKHFKGQEELLSQEAERLLAKLPKATPVDRSRWVSRLSAVEKKAVNSYLENLKKEGYPVDSLLFAWNPLQVARRVRMHCIGKVEGPQTLGIRAMISSAAGWSCDTLADADPDHPVIVERFGNEITIVHLRRLSSGAYEVTDFEWLERAGGNQAEPDSVPPVEQRDEHKNDVRQLGERRDGAGPDNVRGLREYSGSWGRVEAGFVPDATSIVVGQPLFIDFVVRNTGGTDLAFQMGGDNRGSVRHNRFMIVARVGNGDDAPLPDPHDYGHGGGKLDIIRLAPGETYRQPLLLQHWVSLDAAWQQLALRLNYGQQQAGTGTGQLSISAAHTLAIEDSDRPDQHVAINDGFVLTLGAANDEALGAVVERLEKQCQSTDPYVRRKAISALSTIKHPAGVDVLLEELRRAAEDDRPETTERVLGALGNHLDDKHVAEALIRFVADPDRAGQLGGGRIEACRLLAKCKHPKVTDTLIHLASTEMDSMQTQAVWGLRNIDRQRAVEFLYGLLKKTKPTDLVRGAIAKVLCEHGEPLDREWVMPLIRDWPGAYQTYSTAVTVIAEHGGLADARAIAACLRDVDTSEVSSFNARIIQAIQKLGGPVESYRWLDGNRIKDPSQRKRNQQAIEAYRDWASSGDGK